MKNLRLFSLLILLLAISCNTDTKQEVQIPDGQYETTESGATGGKTKMGKLIREGVSLADDQINLNDIITVTNNKISSITLIGQKEFDLVRSGTDDSLFLADMPTTGGATKKIEVRLTKEKHLKIYLDKILEYKPR